MHELLFLTMKRINITESILDHGFVSYRFTKDNKTYQIVSRHTLGKYRIIQNVLRIFLNSK